MDWASRTAITGDAAQIRISATDIASDEPCRLSMALKVRPKVKTVDGWQKLWPDGASAPFPLADVAELVMELQRTDGLDDYAKQKVWLDRRVHERGINRALQHYVVTSVENVIDAHMSVEAALGALTLLSWRPEIGPIGRQLWVWAPLYGTADGVREIRRFRLGSTRDESDENTRAWTATAAYVAATWNRTALPATRVRVVEIGLADGTLSVLFDDTADTARAAFDASLSQRARDLAAGETLTAGRGCGGCKASGSCTALIPVDTVLGQRKRGFQSRSVSASDLDEYRTCPAKWLLNSSLHLPKNATDGDSEAASRGSAVHRWLETAHRRGIGCCSDDLPEPGGELGIAEGVLNADQYAVAYPFLRHHVDECPLSASAVSAIAVEETMYAYDHAADVTVVARPDLVYRDSEGRLVVCEVKTAANAYMNGASEAFDRNLQVAFQLALLDAGVLETHGASVGVVELELLTPTGRNVWSWSTDDQMIVAIARGEVKRIADSWHSDGTWDAKPGPQCRWCAVSRWCPDSDVWDSGPGQSNASDGLVYESDQPTEKAPF